jgi:hypothetical protein
MRPRLAFQVSCLLVSAVLLAGCGGAGKASDNGIGALAPEQIASEAQRAAASAATVHVIGSIVHEGKPISLNVELVSDKGGMGRLAQGAGGLEVVHVDSDVYVNGGEAFYKDIVGTRAARLLSGRWLKASDASGDLAALSALTTLDSVVALTLANHGPLTHAGMATIDGRRAVAVRDRAKAGTLYVAATGTPYPIEVAQPGSRVVFDNWNKPVELSVPEGAVNLKQVQRGRR